MGVRKYTSRHGVPVQFPDEWLHTKDHLDDALGELVARGFLTADGFAGLRALVGEKPSPSRRPGRQKVERKRTTKAAIGRWSIRVAANQLIDTESASGSKRDLRVLPEAATKTQPLHDANPIDPIGENPRLRRERVNEDWAWQLLRRWGVVFRDLLTREDGAPPWYELLQVLRRLEARGEIRGGRFISGVAGEQFALTDSVQHLRRLRDEGSTQELVVVSGADPLNLVGIITRQERVPCTASNRVAFFDGLPVACLQGGEIRWLTQVSRESMPAILERLRSASLLTPEKAAKVPAK